MPKYVIERDIPNVGNVTPDQVIAMSQKSCSVLKLDAGNRTLFNVFMTQDTRTLAPSTWGAEVRG
jgi:hypothetical protein